MTPRSSIFLLTYLLAGVTPLAALAKRSIVIDGNMTGPNDWSTAPAITTCWTDPSADSAPDVTRVCIENDNTAGSNGFLYLRFDTNAASIPNGSAFGLRVDTDGDGVWETSDYTYWVYYDTGFPATYTLWRATSLTTPDGSWGPFGSANNCTGTGQLDWNANRFASGGFGRIGISLGFGCLGLATGQTPMMQPVAYPGMDATYSSTYSVDTGAVTVVRPPGVLGLTGRVVGSNDSVEIKWANPTASPALEGLLILRRTDTWPTGPAQGVTYVAGVHPTDGATTILYSGALKTSHTDAVSGSTRYRYAVYTHRESRTYSLVEQFEAVTDTPNTDWCQSVGYSTFQQPFGDATNGWVYSASNARTITSNAIVTGAEQWSPLALTGVVQARSTIVPINGLTGQTILIGDHSGRAYAVNASTGALRWTGNGGTPLGGLIQAQAGVQFYNSSNATYKTKADNVVAGYKDLAYFATRNNDVANNSVWALDALTGAKVWSYQPGNIDIVMGGMLVDYTNNRLWVGSYASQTPPYSQTSLRVLNTTDFTPAVGGATLNPPPVAQTFAVGHVIGAITRNASTNEAYVPTQTWHVPSGTFKYYVRSYDMTTMTERWAEEVPAPVNSYVVPYGTGFIVATSAGVQRFDVVYATKVRTPRWKNSGGTPTWVAIAGATAPRIDAAAGMVYTTGNTGNVYQLSLDTGVSTTTWNPLWTNNLSTTQALGMGSLDTTSTPKRLFVGGADGRMCAVRLP